MSLDISLLNGAVFNELQASILLTVGDGVTVNGNGTYTVGPNSNGNLAIYDEWSGVVGNPSPGDITMLNTYTGYALPSNSLGVVGYTTTAADGVLSPANGVVGAEVVAWSGSGILLEQLTGYTPNAPTVTPDGNYFFVSSTDISTFDGSITPGETFTLGTTPPIPAAAIPEPSTAMIMPLLVVLMMASRIPAVRSFLGAR